MRLIMQLASAAVGVIGACAAVGVAGAAGDYPVQPVPFTDVRLTGGLWHARQEINNRITLPFALGQCESTGRMKNFDLAAEVMKRRAAGEKTFQHKPPTQFPFDDSDVFKVLEGAAFCLSVQKDPQMEKRVESFIARIAARPGARWLSLHLAHDAPRQPRARVD